MREAEALQLGLQLLEDQSLEDPVCPKNMRVEEGEVVHFKINQNQI